MKTLLASALLAVVLGGCSSTNPVSETPSTAGTIPQGGACATTTDCESPLTCGYAIYNDAGSCKATGMCVAIGAGSVRTFCPCGGGSAFSAYSDGIYATQPVDTTASCGAGTTTPEGGTTPVTPTDSGTTPVTPVDSGPTTPVDSGAPPHDAATGG